MSGRWFIALCACAGFGIACGGEEGEDDTISCIIGQECLQLDNYAEDERCDGEPERDGTCAENGFPHRCEGQTASIYAVDQCSCREGC